MQEKTYRNIADRLGRATDPAVHRLLRACGVEERLITGGASDRERFDALAAALPLCKGHKIAKDLTRIAGKETGLYGDICPHTAQRLWDTWIERHWYGRDTEVELLPDPCPHCAPIVWTDVSLRDMTLLFDPLSIYTDNELLSEWTKEWEACMNPSASMFLWDLPDEYAFVRPDPYHAQMALYRVAEDTATPEEKNLLLTQALRIAILHVKRYGLTLILEGGNPDAIWDLLTYMQEITPMPELVWIPDHPTSAGLVSGWFPSVRTGFRLFDDESLYAEFAPIGRAVVLWP